MMDVPNKLVQQVCALVMVPRGRLEPYDVLMLLGKEEFAGLSIEGYTYYIHSGYHMRFMCPKRK